MSLRMAPGRNLLEKEREVKFIETKSGMKYLLFKGYSLSWADEKVLGLDGDDGGLVP